MPEPMIPSPPPEPSIWGRFVNFLKFLFVRFISDFTRMPRWHKRVLLFAIIACGLGWGDRLIRKSLDRGHSRGQAMVGPEQNSPAVARPGAVGATTASPVHPPAVDTDTVDAQARLATWGRRVGGSLLIGFVVGWIYRTFLKTMALVTTALGSVLALISFSCVDHLAFLPVRMQYNHASAWVNHEVKALKNRALSQTHSGVGATLGLFMGARRRKARIAEHHDTPQ